MPGSHLLDLLYKMSPWSGLSADRSRRGRKAIKALFKAAMCLESIAIGTIISVALSSMAAQYRGREEKTQRWLVTLWELLGRALSQIADGMDKALCRGTKRTLQCLIWTIRRSILALELTRERAVLRGSLTRKRSKTQSMSSNRCELQPCRRTGEQTKKCFQIFATRLRASLAWWTLTYERYSACKSSLNTSMLHLRVENTQTEKVRAAWSSLVSDFYLKEDLWRSLSSLTTL